MESFAAMFDPYCPGLVLIGLQFLSAGLSILVKESLNKGMSVHVLVVYRMAIASAVLAPFALVFEREIRPKMTFSIFAKIMLLSFFEPVAVQNLYYTGMKYTTATFTTAMSNLLPAFTFAMACIFRYEKMNIRKLHCQAKVVGTIVSIGGAMVLSLVKGNYIDFPWSNHHHHDSQKPANNATDNGNFVEGSIMIAVGCVIYASYYILLEFILKSYPAKLSFAALQCTMGMVQGIIVAFIIENRNTSVWSIHKDIRLPTYLYGGVYSGLSYYLTAIVTNTKGSVFTSIFTPLSMVFVTIMGPIFLHEQMYLGMIVGAIVIVMGMYMVIWGKTKDEHLQSDTENVAKPDHEDNTHNPTSESNGKAAQNQGITTNRDNANNDIKLEIFLNPSSSHNLTVIKGVYERVGRLKIEFAF